MDNNFFNQNPDQTNLPSQPSQNQPISTQNNPQDQLPEKSYRKIWLIIIILVIIIATGLYFYFTRSISNRSDTNPASQESSNGLINKNQIGCQKDNLFVLSVAGGKTPVDKNGNYHTNFSSDMAQWVFLVNDQDTLCASAISLPKDNNQVIFDAESTAKTMVFQSPGILSTNPNKAEERLKMIVQLKSFPELLTYIKENLPSSDLASLKETADLNTLLEKCILEMTKKLNEI